jgi:hypothetical protein
MPVTASACHICKPTTYFCGKPRVRHCTTDSSLRLHGNSCSTTIDSRLKCGRQLLDAYIMPVTRSHNNTPRYFILSLKSIDEQWRPSFFLNIRYARGHYSRLLKIQQFSHSKKMSNNCLVNCIFINSVLNSGLKHCKALVERYCASSFFFITQSFSNDS